MSNSGQQGKVLTPKDDAFAKADYAPPMMHKGAKFFIFDHEEYPDTGGIFIHYKGMKYPKKGFPYPEAIMANDMFKKAVKAALAPIGKHAILPLLGFVLTPWRWKLKAIEAAVHAWAEMGDCVYAPHYLQPMRYCEATQEIWRGTAIGLNALGVKNQELCDRIGRIAATVFEYDDSYKYFLQDLLGEGRLFKLRYSPSATLRQMGQVFYDRTPVMEDGYRDIRVAEMVRRMFRILSLAAKHPKVRKAIKAGAWAMNPGRVEMDDSDWYHNLIRSTYDFRGVSLRDRLAEYNKIHKDGLPPRIELT